MPVTLQKEVRNIVECLLNQTAHSLYVSVEVYIGDPSLNVRTSKFAVTRATMKAGDGEEVFVDPQSC